MAAGLSYWHLGTFELYRVNPPLVRMIGTLPVLACRHKVDWSRFHQGSTHRSEWNVGRDYVTANGEAAFLHFAMARWACIPFSVIGAWTCYQWARALYGGHAGLLALALWCLCPNLVAYASLMTADVGAAALGVLCCYGFWIWQKRPSWRNAAAAGVLLGLAELTKMTWMPLFVVWPLVWIWRRYNQNGAARDTFGEAVQVLVVLSVGVITMNVGYGFEGSFTRLGSYEFVSDSLQGQHGTSGPRPVTGNRFARTCLANLPLPLPSAYVSGLDLQKRDLEEPGWSYLRGKLQPGGWWYYYLYAMAVKVPVGTWVLTGMGLLSCCRRCARLGVDETLLLVPAVAVLLLVSSQTGFSRYLRYVLPVFPFWFIWIGRLLRSGKSGRIRQGAVLCCVIWTSCSSLSVFPHVLSYFNEAAGGPLAGDAHLIDANIDWGQDMHALKKWQQSRPGARPLFVHCHSSLAFEQFGINADRMPASPVPGWYAVSVHKLRTDPQRYWFLLRRQPDEFVAYSIRIYRVSAWDLRNVRP
jgi:hypothetical protein